MNQVSGNNGTHSIRLAITPSTLIKLICMASFTTTVLAQETVADLATDDLFNLSLEELFNIEVTTASKTAESADTAPATIYVVTENDIRKNGYFSLAEVLENIPGVVPINLDFFAFGGQRGFLSNFSQTLLMLDGREMQNLIAAETFISDQFATNNVKQIEVINGPGSALYGANAFVGVINVITKSGSRDFNQVQLHAEVGSEDTRGYSVIAGHKGQDWRISGSLRFYESDNWDFTDFVQDRVNFSDGYPAVHQGTTTASTEGYLNRSKSENATLKVEYKGFYLGTDSFHLTNGKGLENVSTDYNSQRDIRKLRLSYAGWAGDLEENSSLSVEWRHYKERFWGVNYPFDETGYQTIIDDRQMAGIDLTLPITSDEIQNNFLSTYSQENSSGSTRDRIDLQYKTKLGDKTDLIAGLTYDEQDVLGIALSSSDISPPFDETVSDDNPLHKPFFKTDKKSLFVQVKHAMMENKLFLTLGGRRDDHSLYGAVNTFRSGLVYQLSEATYVKGLFGQAFREPNIFEQGAFSSTSNLSLTPAEVDTYEVSINHTFGQHVKANAVYYVNIANDFIVPSFTDVFFNLNEEVKVSGLETQLLFSYQRFSGDIGYSYVNADDTDIGGRTYENVNNYEHRLSAGVNYQISETWNLNARINYYDEVLAEHGNPDVDAVFSIDSATKVDLTLSSHQIKLDDMTLQFNATIKNAFDQDFYMPNVRNGGPKQFLQPGRQFMLRFNLQF